MQVENAAEWAQRERLSSEKYSLERENKRLKALLEDLESEVKKRHTGLSNAKDADVRSLQSKLAEKNTVVILSLYPL